MKEHVIQRILQMNQEPIRFQHEKQEKTLFFQTFLFSRHAHISLLASDSESPMPILALTFSSDTLNHRASLVLPNIFS